MVRFILMLVLLYIVVSGKWISKIFINNVKQDVCVRSIEVKQRIDELLEENGMVLLYQDKIGAFVKFAFYVFLSVCGVIQLVNSHYGSKEGDITILVLMITIAIAIVEAKTNYIQFLRLEQQVHMCWSEIIDSSFEYEKWIAQKEAKIYCKEILRRKSGE